MTTVVDIEVKRASKERRDDGTKERRNEGTKEQAVTELAAANAD